MANRDEGIRWLYETYAKKLVGYSVNVYHVTQDTAWDLAYKTIYKVLDNAASYHFENEGKLGAFMFKMFINYLKNYLRDEQVKTRGAKFISLEESKRDFSNRKENVLSREMKILQEELDKLADWQRILLLMRSQDIAYSEIVKYVNKPEEQLKVYYQRLKQQLAERIKEKLNPSEATAHVTGK